MKKEAKKGGEALKHIVTFRATDGDFISLQALATLRNTSASEALRGMIRREVSRQVSKGGRAVA